MRRPFFGHKRFWAILILVLAVVTVFGIIRPPSEFKNDTIIEIEEGDTVKSVSEKLRSNNIIRSEGLFSGLVQISRSHVVAGKYIFRSPENLLTIVRRMARGNYGSNPVSVTLFEGMTNREMAGIIKHYIPNFDEEMFIELTQDKEGYLFPDTYTLSDLSSPREVIRLIEDNFNQKIISIQDEIDSSKYTLSEIIIMASIVEREADSDSKQEVANILWKRYEEEFPLQVDAPFVYSIGKGTFDLTDDDLQSKDNPYNTYVNVGLVPTPISNPGLDAILAAAHPEETDYYYFLTGNDGKMYYAKTFEQHKENRLLYLD